MKKSLLFIANPTSGKGIIKNKLCDICDLFIKQGYHIEIHTTQAKNDAYEVVKKSGKKFDLIVCSGGDGTLNEVIRALIDADIKNPFAYIPTGTTNDFATTMKLSKQPLKCVQQIINGKPKAIDIGSLNGTSFVYIAAFGIFSDVSYTTPQATKNILGHSAYVLEGLKQFISMKEYSLTIEYDGNIMKDDFCYGMITNTLSVGGIHFFSEDNVDLNDGYFECLFIKRPNNPIDMQQLFQSLVSKDLSKCSRVSVFKAKTIKVTCDHALSWNVDGEYGGDLKECTIINHPCALNIIK